MTKEPINYWSLRSAIEQIQKCGFECEGGSIENNDAWVWLCGIARKGPEFCPGQGVWFEVKAEAPGAKLSSWAHFYIVGCHMKSDTERRYFEYSLSQDPPGPWHYGEVHYRNVRGEDLRLAKPEPAEGK